MGGGGLAGERRADAREEAGEDEEEGGVGQGDVGLEQRAGGRRADDGFDEAGQDQQNVEQHGLRRGEPDKGGLVDVVDEADVDGEEDDEGGERDGEVELR